MKRYKSNHYNILIPVYERNEFLLFNTLTGGIEILNVTEGDLVAQLSTLKNFSMDLYAGHSDFLGYLYEREYIIEEDRDFIDIFEKHTEATQFKNAGTINLTIGTTITCNMGCSYCFEFVKPNHTLKSPKVKAQIVKYIEQIINSGKPVHTLSVTWYGGEPLINVAAIRQISSDLIPLAEEYQLTYRANIITNGIYLTADNVQTLIDCKVTSAQVTIDGSQTTHDIKRPLKQKNAENYIKILRNLAEIDSALNINIRINVDREVAESVYKMLDDFEQYDIWPKKYRQFHFDTAWLRSYEQISITEEEAQKRLKVDEFFDFKQEFRLSLVKRFNRWAEINNVKHAKLKWDLPKYQSTCATWASPISLVIDPNGNIHKCWETIHDETLAPTSIFQDYDPQHFKSYSSFNRYNHNPVCTNCKYLPVCDKISCSYEALRSKVPQCTEWKYKAENYIREQYLRMIDQPETIIVPEASDAVNSGHSNK